MNADILLDFTHPGPFTTLDASAAQVDALPADVPTLARTVQNLLMHRFWSQAYNVEIPPERTRAGGALRGGHDRLRDEAA